ncbi:MAG: hypothetical protein HY361_02640 [Candidatus Aenigmarchaeota archaeon]|nr:hypothetical protein [Candidatus Aenigmarchaeota archaeon]
MELATQLNRYAENLFVERDGLWRLKDDFVKWGARGLYVPQSFVNAQYLKEVVYNAFHAVYWDRIGKSFSGPTIYAINLPDETPPHLNRSAEMQTPKQETQEGRPQSPGGGGKISKFLAKSALGLTALGGLTALSLFLYPRVSYFFAPSIEEDKAIKGSIKSEGRVIPWKVPKEQGREIYQELRPDLEYEDAFITDIPFVGGGESLETLVAFSEGDSSYFAVLDEKGKNASGRFTLPIGGRDYELYPVGATYGFDEDGYSVNAYTFFVVSNHENELLKHNQRQFQGFQIHRRREAQNILELFGKKLSLVPYGGFAFDDNLKNFRYLVGDPSRSYNKAWFEDIKFKEVNRGRHLIVSYENGVPVMTVVYLATDFSSSTSDEPFVIARYEASGTSFKNITRDEDVRGELVRLFLEGELSREDLDAIKVTVAKNELIQRFKTTYTRSRQLDLLQSLYGDNYEQKVSGWVFEELHKYTSDSPKRIQGLVDIRNLNEAVRIIESVNAKGTELYIASANAASQGRDPSKEVASALNVDDEMGSEIFRTVFMPSLFAVNSKTRRLEPLELTLYQETSEAEGILPYQKDVVLILDFEARQVALKHGIYLGRDNRLGLDINFTTTPEDMEARRLPRTNLTLVDDKKVVARTGSLYQQVQEGSITQYEFLREADSIRRDLGLVPSLDEMIGNVRTASMVVDILYRGGTAKDLVDALSGGSEEKRGELAEFIDYLEFVAPILRGEIPTYTGEAGTSESELEEIKIPSIADVLGEACAQLSICK